MRAPGVSFSPLLSVPRTPHVRSVAVWSSLVSVHAAEPGTMPRITPAASRHDSGEKTEMDVQKKDAFLFKTRWHLS